ncbi:MAG: hypothetical protein SOS22_02855 [Absicoccus sp.]|uniref:hypothetical protein n=1 Tax=Absicoccus sp. TaxID=2718527 RepID=UPI002A754088|nr:hypothetical protein [Absicoccus sp.]MDY3035135.1 hypothetical protein [Absicoccus sp.]
MKKFILLLALGILLSGCSSSIDLQKHTFTYELGADVYGNPKLYIKNADHYDTKNMKVVPQSKGIYKEKNRFVNKGKEYLVCGTYDFTLINGNQKIPFKIKIKDTQAPLVNQSPTEITCSVGAEPDYQTAFDASDLSGVNYESDVDTSTTGTKATTVRIYDRFGNTVEKKVNIVVQ